MANSTWIFLVLTASAASGLGVLISYVFPGGRTRAWEYEWKPGRAFLLGIGPGLFVPFIISKQFPNRLVLIVASLLVATIAAYIYSRMPGRKASREEEPDDADTSSEKKTKQMRFRPSWNSRPRYENENEDEGVFVGRTDSVERLNSHFISDGGGTILISGVRGVGKTALVDRALVSSRSKLQDRYWKETSTYLQAARSWHVFDRAAHRKLGELGGGGGTYITDPSTLKRGADAYVKRKTAWWQKLSPVDRRIRRMYDASRWQLLVLKFSASDISGALPLPEQETTTNPQIDPEKLLRSIIRKLYVTCHPSASEPEARVLEWSLRNKAERQLFFDTLQAAYQKSISKSYKETISNSITAALKESQTSTLEGKLNLEKIGIVLVCVLAGAAGAYFNWDLPTTSSTDFYLKVLGLPAAIVGYVLLSWTVKRTREKTSDQSNQTSFSYEYDYSLHRMQQDLETLLRTLSPGRQDAKKPHDPYRCFRHTVIVFDELDKLEETKKQLESVIMHFKNFFTLSEAVFVFLTDHEFYERLARVTVEARSNRHYPPEHTFFTEKIYLRKPEFRRFREAFFKFTENTWLEEHAASDPILIDDLLKLNEKLVAIVETLPLSILTPLYVQKGQYKSKQKTAIAEAFAHRGGMTDPLALANIWANRTESLTDTFDPVKARADFDKAEGWSNSAAISFLYEHREADVFTPEDQNEIDDRFNQVPGKLQPQYKDIDSVDFTLSDLARALCFQTRNHYFDLYSAVYDYVSSYEDGAPVVELDTRYTHEPRLWSRYQQLVEIAFDSAKEDHPSREYFNGLLMESLYGAFEKGRNGESVSIREILFPSPPVESAVQAKAPAENNGHENGSKKPVDPFTERDAEKINQAIIRLLRLALAHDAIRCVTPDMSASLNRSTVKPSALAEFQFAWTDDSQPIIRSVIREQYEEELLDFWETQKAELDAFDRELGAVWSQAPITGESLKMRMAIGDLRAKADLVRLRQGTVSRPDARVLQANVGTAESREALWPRLIVERIRAEDDADVIEDFSKPRTDVVIKQLIARKVELEQKTLLKINAIIRPRDTDYVFYLVVMSPPGNTIHKGFIESLLPEKTALIWYATGKEETLVISGSSKFRVYTSPSATPPLQTSTGAQLIADYSAVVSAERLKEVITRLEPNYKDAQLLQRAGAEVLGPVNANSDLYKALRQPDLTPAIKLLRERRDSFIEKGVEAVPNVSEDETFSAVAAASQLALDLAVKGRLSSEFSKIIQQAVVRLYVEPNRITRQVWLKTFMDATQDPKMIPQMLLKELIAPEVVNRLQTASPNSQLSDAIELQFVPWLAGNIQTLAETKSTDLSTLLSSPDWTIEIEKQLRAMRLSPLPAKPVAPPAAQTLPSKSKKQRPSLSIT
ncbi:MAG TPA: ATP-binding protein [Pyrinomonadaceae bacterium]|nr:ATP-binding protein [Pyrinomonadaceae bacterium]